MNKARRKRLDDVIHQLRDMYDELTSLQEEEQESADNMPENLQDSDRYHTMCEIADDFEEAANDLDDILDRLDETLNK